MDVTAWRSRDYFAEMYVAGVMADAGWDVYFPRRDKGFDMIVTIQGPSGIALHPVQVKGKYCTDGKTDKARYGFVGRLTALHADMLLVIPFFTSADAIAPRHIAWMPHSTIKTSSRGHACEPATFKLGEPRPRRDFAQFFDESGLTRLVKD